MCLFILVFLLDTIVMNDESPKQIITPLIAICISFIFNWISWMQSIWIQFKLHAMSFNIFNRIELSFHKMNSFIHHIIINGNAKQCGTQVELCNVQMFYEYVVFWYHLRKKDVYHSMWLKNTRHYILFMMIVCACDTRVNTFMQLMSKYCY